MAAERYARLAEQLISDGWKVCLTGAPSEADVANKVHDAAARKCINLAGRTSLGEVAAIIDGARLLISNDTGVSHIAAARRTPSIVLVLGSEPSRWLPMDRNLHSSVSIEVPCRPCFHASCPIGFPCAEELSVEWCIGKFFRNSAPTHLV